MQPAGLLLTLGIIEDRIVVEVSEERLRRDRLGTGELAGRRRRAEGVGNFAEVGDEVRGKVVRADRHRIVRQLFLAVGRRCGQRRGRARVWDSRNVARGLRLRLRHHRVLICDRRVQVVSLELVLGGHQVLHLLLVLGVKVLRRVRVHQAEPYSPAVFVPMLLYEVYLLLAECRHGNGFYPMRRSQPSSASTKEKFADTQEVSHRGDVN